MEVNFLLKHCCSICNFSFKATATVKAPGELEKVYSAERYTI